MRTETIINTYGLPEHLASEIIATETQRALRTKWQAWVLLLTTILLAVWLQFFGPENFEPIAIWVVIGGVSLWALFGRYSAASAIHKAAMNKAQRLSGKYP